MQNSNTQTPAQQQSEVEEEQIESSPIIYCKVKEHQGELITHVCFNVGCKSFRPHCKRCNLSLHRDCHDHVKFLDDLTLQMNQIQEKNRQMLKIVTEDVKTLQKLERQLQLRCGLIEKYIQQSNLTNLNNLAGILESDENYDLNKLLEGQKQLSSHYIQNIVIKDDDLKIMNQKSEIPKENSEIKEQINIISTTNEKKEKKENSIIEKKKPNIKITEVKNESQNQQQRVEQIKPEKIQKSEKPRTMKPPKIDLDDLMYDNKGTNANTANTNTNSNINRNNTQPNTNNSNLIDEGSAQQYHMKAQYCRKNQKHAESLEYFDMAILLNPNNPSYWNNKGTALNSLDRDFESIEYFDKALEIVNSKPLLDRESKFAYLRNKASALIKLDQFENSIKTINEGLALDPLNKHFIKLKYTSLLHFQRFDEALEFVNELIQLNSNDYKPHQMKVAGILIKFQKFQEAMDCFCLANSIKPKKGTYFLLGKLLEQLCRFDEAESCYQSALKLDQNYYQARQQLQIVQQYIEFK